MFKPCEKQLVLSTQAEVSSQVERSNKFPNHKKLENKIYYVGKDPKETHQGTAKDKIPQDNAKSDDKTVDKHDGNLVFYQTERTQKEKARKKTSILLKSTPNNVLNVGDGLDLARASILPRRSSPSIVTSCVGNQVTLKCAAEGNPAPEFTWYKGKQTVNKDKSAEFDLKIAPSKFTRASHLTFTPNGKDDFGEYQCAASNTLGATQQSTHRIVLSDKGEPLCTQSTFNRDKKKYNSIIVGTVASVGMLLVLLCIAGFVFWRLNQQEADCKSK
ncbi:junctional adhesion molecule A [Paramuricea clavata]|uniref:Junctional adhesion molecule A n=1 Tax=Paramuricea clavata TaxID=317549 RepID=A0A6S7HB46_PARCT|nr:junctional adhesion molecule A [Paramuricea clavata]